jgi:hypothetical protein
MLLDNGHTALSEELTKMVLSNLSDNSGEEHANRGITI